MPCNQFRLMTYSRATHAHPQSFSLALIQMHSHLLNKSERERERERIHDWVTILFHQIQTHNRLSPMMDVSQVLKYGLRWIHSILLPAQVSSYRR